MARSINEIRNDLISRVQSDSVLGPLLTSTSTVAIWLLWIDILAFCYWPLELLHDIFKIEVNEIIARDKSHTLRWYAEKVKSFQYGFNLATDEDYYDNTGIDPTVITASKIVNYSAVVEQIRGIRIKVAKSVGSDLGPLTTGEMDSLINMVEKVKDAGVKIDITTSEADKLKLVIRVKYNPLVLNDSGARIDGLSLTPVNDAIKYHLKNLPFNGIFSVQSLVDAIQAVEGVTDLNIDQVQTKYGALPFTSVNIDVVPDSGYLVIDDADLLISYLPA